MVYNNLLYRSLFSVILLLVYIFSLNNTHILFSLATVIYLIIFYECFKFFNKYFYQIFIYLLFSLFSFYYYFFNFFNIYLFNIFIFTIILFDSLSYFSGMIFGKNHIFQKISPKKTLEGYIGGIFFTNLLLILYFILTDKNKILNFIIFINIIVIFSIIGDLLQSFFKRKNKIKNSSSYLPGHGGFFDRFDSFIMAIIFLFLYSLIYS